MTAKKRRIIYNDDGAAEKPVYNPEATVEGFLSAYFNASLGTQVDSWFYNYGDCWLREDGSLYPCGPFAEARQSAGVFGDANEIVLKATRDAGMERFASLRMNDVHCGSNGIVEPFKLNRTDLLIGEHWPDKYPCLLSGETPVYDGGYPEQSMLVQFWAAFDYAKPEVRQYRLDFIRQLCAKYDWDGIELDFMRMPLFFKPGEEDENLDTMTDFMRQVRAILDQIARGRGRPYLLAVRVPPTPEIALRTGLDVESWLSEGLIQLLVPSTENWLYFTRFKPFVDMGHRHGVPVYLCHCAQLWTKELGDPGVVIRSITSNFHAMGADGVYLFNFTYWSKEVSAGGWLNQIGDPDTLAGFDKCYRPETGDYGRIQGYGVGAGSLPSHIVHGPTIEIVVGDDVRKAARMGTLKELRLKIGVADVHEVEGLRIRVNGERVSSESIRRVDQDSFEVLLQAPPVRQGINEIVILPGRKCIGRLASLVTEMELWVRYKHA